MGNKVVKTWEVGSRSLGCAFEGIIYTRITLSFLSLSLLASIS